MDLNEQQAVGQRLRSARETLGLTQEDVAGALGIQRTSVIAMEAGKRNVGALELRRLARIYRRSVAWILGEEPDAEIVGDNGALFRATAELSPQDKEQVLRFAEFLAAAKAQQTSKPRARTARTRPVVDGD
ncbi:helix-turn-helix transcriptional regulator [Nocardioides sp. GXZ039]|uniref:helix-turn-helix transcriptional regulator n=1 Tax=Nocardioides sp. GXZ039 TaxID=3136018 RepID=UPI0030F3922B